MLVVIQLVDSTSAPVEVLSAGGGDSAVSASFQFAINFGLVLGFSLTGDKIAENPVGAPLTLVKMQVSSVLAGCSSSHHNRRCRDLKAFSVLARVTTRDSAMSRRLSFHRGWIYNKSVGRQERMPSS